MKYIKKYIYIFICSAFLLLIAVFISTKEKTTLPSFFIYGSDGTIAEEISMYDAGNRNYYVFLPSYADAEQVTVTLNTAKKVSAGDVALYEGMDCGNFAFETPYIYSVNGKKTATIWFYRSENVATMHIDTVTGSMERIHKDKNYEETAAITLYTADGIINYADENSTLKGRGNSTWNYDKRPYSLILSEEGNLLGMGEACNWVLLANAKDETNLNNKLALDLASRTGMLWTPESRWVDVYLNGEYSGLYLLTEKVETHRNRLDIDTDSGAFLCKIDYIRRWETLRNPFMSESRHAVEISYPKIISEAQIDTVVQLVNQMEESLMSGEDLCNSAIIDLDSWICKYLIDEICGNADSELASFYFYFSDGVFSAGPVWDYDLIFGNHYRNQEPFAFIAKNLQKSDTLFSPYYDALYRNEYANSRMKEIYRTEFRPIIQNLLDCEIDDLSNHIGSASRMNSIRWGGMFRMLQNQVPNSVHTPEELKAYLSARAALLDSAWLENTDFCTVQFEASPGNWYWNISVKQGTCLETEYMDIVSGIWIDNATGEVFDFTQPVMTDMILSRQMEEVSSRKNPVDAKQYITYLSVAVLLILLVGLSVVDTTRRFKEKRKAENAQHAKVLQ